MPLWFKILHFFAEKYGWTSKEVGDLTLDQMQIYLSGGKNPDEPELNFEDPQLFKARLLADGMTPTKKETKNVQARRNVRGVRGKGRRVG